MMRESILPGSAVLIDDSFDNFFSRSMINAVWASAAPTRSSSRSSKGSHNPKNSKGEKSGHKHKRRDKINFVQRIYLMEKYNLGRITKKAKKVRTDLNDQTDPEESKAAGGNSPPTDPPILFKKCPRCIAEREKSIMSDPVLDRDEVKSLAENFDNKKTSLKLQKYNPGRSVVQKPNPGSVPEGVPEG